MLFCFSVCSEGKNEDLLHEVILVVGYFTVLNNDNQVSNENLSIFFPFVKFVKAVFVVILKSKLTPFLCCRCLFRLGDLQHYCSICVLFLSSISVIPGKSVVRYIGPPFRCLSENPSPFAQSPLSWFCLFCACVSRQCNSWGRGNYCPYVVRAISMCLSALVIGSVFSTLLGGLKQ